MIQNNRARRADNESLTAARKGLALLVGLFRCGHCGRKLHVHYWGARGSNPRYLCRGTYGSAGDYCIGFSGASVERAVVNEVLEVISPHGVKASLVALEELAHQSLQRCELLRKRLASLEYETTRAFEQYNQVDPRNRLVASELERRWNSKLEQSRLARAALDKELVAQRDIDESTKERIAHLGAHFSQVWNHPDCSPILKKNILRIVLHDILVLRKPTGLELTLHWTAGVHTVLDIHQPSQSIRRTSESTLDILRRLAPNYDDSCIAAVLNRNRILTATGCKWTQGRVAAIRRSHAIDGGIARPRPGILNLRQAMQVYSLSHYVIHRLIQQGLVRNEQTVPLAPLELHQQDLDSDSVQRALLHLKKNHRFPQGGVCNSQQSLLPDS